MSDVAIYPQAKFPLKFIGWGSLKKWICILELFFFFFLNHFFKKQHSGGVFTFLSLPILSLIGMEELPILIDFICTEVYDVQSSLPG